MPEPLEPDSTPSATGIESTASALDRLAAELETPATEVTTPPPVVPPVVPAAGTPAETPSDPPKPEVKPAETPVVTETPATPTDKPPAEPTTPPVVESALQKELETIQLPPHARPKSAESFTKVKQIALQHEQALRKEIEARDARLKEIEAKVSAAPDPAVVEENKKLREEVEELRKSRATFDVENDPSFKEFDKRAEKNHELVYNRLLKVGVKPEQIAQIRKIGGPSHVDWSKFKDSLDPSVLQFIDLKLAENIGIEEEKQLAIETAKKNAPEFLSQRGKKDAEVRHRTADEYRAKADWLKAPAPLPANATDDQKKQHAAETTWIKEQEARIKQGLEDASPEMHATLAVGNALAFEYSRQLRATNNYLERILKETIPAKDQEVAAAKAELKKVQDELARIKNSSRSITSALGGAEHKAPQPTGWKPGLRTEDALDAIAAQVQAQSE